MDTAPYEHLLASCEAARCAAHGTRRASTCTREEYRLLHRGYRLARRLGIPGSDWPHGRAIEALHRSGWSMGHDSPEVGAESPLPAGQVAPLAPSWGLRQRPIPFPDSSGAHLRQCWWWTAHC